MGRYTSGDVILAPMRIGGAGEWKVRPAVVIATEEDGSLLVCPISSKSPSDTPSVQLSLDDFIRGGLDLFEESYVLTAYPLTTRPAGVVARKGSLQPEAVAAIQESLPAACKPRRK
ncbi:MAG: type II toxin-antitoxin system PemK/MazF family toxin [Methanomicrobiales archaeon]|nr:type II toxin-antitoxin system PemK/MazF family toxin [Methanomicrobiales archaeon]